MQTSIIKFIEKRTWYLQLLLGTIIAILTLVFTSFLQGHNLLALVIVGLLATIKEQYLEHKTGEAFHWRNFMLLLIPVVFGYVILHWQ
ncbi:hypothetical protein [Zunongwangia sp.]|uniref:hypothetical protein n=1 Tax=Zunongwangia sp. TaxID=1965325 RepID=UPI003AA9A68B